MFHVKQLLEKDVSGDLLRMRTQERVRRKSVSVKLLKGKSVCVCRVQR